MVYYIHINLPSFANISVRVAARVLLISKYQLMLVQLQDILSLPSLLSYGRAYVPLFLLLRGENKEHLTDYITCQKVIVTKMKV